MKTILKLSALFFCVAFILFACKKNDDNNEAQFSPELLNFFKSHEVPTQTFTINAGQYNTLTGAKGTTLYIAANAFLKPNGDPVTGNISITLREVYGKKDMLLSGAPTLSNGNLLVSGGEIYINATQNGEQLTLQPGSLTMITPPQAPSNGVMQLFFGTGNSGVNASEPTTLNWILSDSSIVYTGDTLYDTIPREFYYTIPPKLGWINCDYFLNNPNPKDTLKAQLSGDFNSFNTMVFVSLNGINTAAGLYPFVWGTASVNFSSQYTIPNAMNVTVVTISNINGQFYYSETPAVTGPGVIVYPVPLPITEADMLTALDNLP